jgi:hypothetical protein
MEIIVSILIIILIIIGIWKILCKVTEFDTKIKQIEDILNSSAARSRKYELFDMLGKLADNCSNYNQLSKMNELLGRVYAL